MYIVARSAAQGRAAGLASTAGIHVGTLVHIGAAIAGLSALLAASATAFTVVKLVGATYLVFLGVQSLRSYRSGLVETEEPVVETRSLRRIFVDGVVLNVLNPKTAIFFLSFVPQFVDPGSVNPALDLALLGATFIVLGVIADGMFAIAGGAIGTRMRRSPHLQRRTNLISGGTYIGLGALTAASGSSS